MSAAPMTARASAAGRTSTPAIVGIAAGLAALAAVSVWAVQHRLGVREPVATDQVELLLNDFRPDAVAVPVGAAVTWHFDGTTTHDIVGEGWGTPARAEGVFAHTFTEAGTYDFRCTIHGPMRGRVVVR